MLSANSGNSLRSRLKKSNLEYETLYSKHEKLLSELETLKSINLNCIQENASLYTENSLLKNELKTLVTNTELQILKIKNVDRIFNSHWVADCSNCSNCNVKFGIFIRKHHCRKCGNIMCSNCTVLQNMSLLTLELKQDSSFAALKVCKNCINV